MYVDRPDGKRFEFLFGGDQYISSTNTPVQLMLLNNEYALRLTSQGDVFDRDELDRMVMDEEMPGLQSVASLGETHALLLEDSIEFYDARGWLVRIQNFQGQPTFLAYSATENNQIFQAQVSRVETDLLIRFESLPFAKMAKKVVVPGGAVINYIYDTQNYLTKVSHTDEFGVITDTFTHEHVRGYEGKYAKTYNINKIFDAEGRQISNVVYDNTARAIRSEAGAESSNISATSLSYQGNITTVTNALGKSTQYTFEDFQGVNKITKVEGQASENCAASNKAYNYDAQGRLMSKTDWNGNTTEYARDTFGREISRTEAFGTPEARTITTEWHPTLNLPIKMKEPARETSYTYNDNGQLLSTDVRNTAE